MARLTNEQWAEARKLWESDESVSYQQIADKFGCSRPAVGQKAEREGWVRGGAPAAPVPPTPAAKTPKAAKVSPPPKESKVSPKAAPKVSAPPPQEGESTQRMSAADWQLVTGKRPVGRPTEYRDEFVAELIAYFDVPVQSWVEVDELDKDGKVVTRKQLVTNTFPTLTRFAAKIGVTRQTLHDWATSTLADGAPKHPEFAYAYARAKDAQESLIVEGGMGGMYEPRFATLAAKNLAGWKDQIESKNEVTVVPVDTKALDDTYSQAMEQMRANKAKVLARNASSQAAALDAVLNPSKG